MTRSLLRPIRTRRVVHPAPVRHPEAESAAPALTPGTRKTLAAIGALWVSFAASAAVAPNGTGPLVRASSPGSAKDAISEAGGEGSGATTVAARLNSHAE
jgi:hypothetical protein